MKKKHIIITKLLLKTKNWKKYEHISIILKFYNKTNLVSKNIKFLINLKKWTLSKKFFLSFQTNVCKINGNYKKTFDKIGINRHAVRQLGNINKLIHIKKISW